MSTTYPRTFTPQTEGEKVLFNKLLELSDDWHVFYEPIIEGNKPDFIIFHPNLGITIIEVKDYTQNSLISVDPKTWRVNIGGVTKSLTSPIEQVIQYRNKLIKRLGQSDSLLTQVTQYQGKLKVPVSVICCFPYIKKEQACFNVISSIIPHDMLIVKEDLSNANLLLQKISMSFHRLFSPDELTQEEERIIIQSIFPSASFKDIHPRDSDINEIIQEIKYLKFNNYVEELFFIVDKISHIYNTEVNEVQKIIIFYNELRSTEPNSLAYVNLLKELLSSRNISANTIKLTTYSQINHQWRDCKYNFLIDFNKIALLKLIENNPGSILNLLNSNNTHITTSYHIPK
ncbi:NERD domain-containing protein [Cytobacillus firmus]|uniref:nuclease-related domain-containing protein n=1 Tax=Cytobacillus TaxID=2675230 RepID=UPI00207977CB|nr:nuclease-related domain-containing protein [Cytobacillus firmus]USK37127.1 NERD domain-containing protein [Cytobacillus firmus]